MKSILDSEISSQASWRQDEGSTTRVWSLSETVEPQECVTRKGRYSLNLWETIRCEDKELHDNKLNSIPYTQKVRTLSEMSVPEQIRTVLENDMSVVLDSAAATQFQASDYVATIVNTATTTFGSASAAVAAQGANMSDKNVRDIIDQMKKLNIPRHSNGKYKCIASTEAIRGLYDFFEAKAQNTTMAPLEAGMVGEYYGCDFIEETNFLSNVTGTGSVYGEAIFFGADAVREGIAIPEEIRIDIPKDFGRDQGIAWYALLGFNKTWDFGDDGETRIIRTGHSV